MTVAVDSLGWLQEYAAGRGAWSAAPWTHAIDGEVWSGATTGYMAVMVRAVSDYPRAGQEIKALVAELARVDAETHDVELAAFRAWLVRDLPAEPVTATCEECKGRGRVECDGCGGEGFHVCPDCSVEHECGTCDGEGVTPCPDCTPGLVRTRRHDGLLYGVPVDRKLFAVVSRFTSERARLRVAGPRAPLILSGAGWHIFAMPLSLETTVGLVAFPEPRAAGAHP